jgi:hypothetical protein
VAAAANSQTQAQGQESHHQQTSGTNKPLMGIGRRPFQPPGSWLQQEGQVMDRQRRRAVNESQGSGAADSTTEKLLQTLHQRTQEMKQKVVQLLQEREGSYLTPNDEQDLYDLVLEIADLLDQCQELESQADTSGAMTDTDQPEPGNIAHELQESLNQIDKAINRSINARIATFLDPVRRIIGDMSQTINDPAYDPYISPISVKDSLGEVGAARNSPCLVIVIEDCAGIMAGRDNVQRNVFSLAIEPPHVAIDEACLRRLFEGESSWGDMVSESVKMPPLPAPAGGSFWSPTQEVSYPDRNILFIVKHSQGVQIGDHNIQRNVYAMWAHECYATMTRVGQSSDRRDAVEALVEDPNDRQTARRLAENIIEVSTGYIADNLANELASVLASRNAAHKGFASLYGQNFMAMGVRPTVTHDIEPTVSKPTHSQVDNVVDQLLKQAEIRRTLREPKTPTDGPV